ncbi:MAG: hypothetical protein LRY73_17745 [Bacillus sp. (in: Bacteria)]|nr:hypothetical protein [Bacillus sp. (in: firmicutes)]
MIRNGTGYDLKVAAVVWRRDWQQVSFGNILSKMQSMLEKCEELQVRVIVFPAYVGSLFPSSEMFVEEMRKLSCDFSGYFCPGSFLEKDGLHIYHTACLLNQGETILWQRQLYRAKWEMGLGLGQGQELGQTTIDGVKTNIILSTDTFYPQVSRHAALSGTELVLAPMAIKRNGNPQASDTLRGVWQNVQSNLFFAVESGWKGSVAGRGFSSFSAIHGPLSVTAKEDGFLAWEANEPGDDGELLVATLPLDDRVKHVQTGFNPLSQLNPDAYTSLFSATEILEKGR